MYSVIRLTKRCYGRAWRQFLSPIVALLFRSNTLKIGKDPIFYGIPIFDIFPRSRVVFGPRAVFCSLSTFTPLGVSHPVNIRTFSAAATIEIGADCGMSGTTICAADRVVIGDGALLGADVQIFDNDFHPLTTVERRYSEDNIGSAPVIIGRNVFVGTRSIILKGVCIGDNSVIAAGSIVTKSIPADSIAGGNPCRVIGVLDMKIRGPHV